MKFEVVQIDFLRDVLICCHPEILLPWQRDVTTSPLYYIIHWVEIYPVDNGIHLFNNWGQSFVLSSLSSPGIPKAFHGRNVDIFRGQEIPTPKRIFIWMKGVMASFVNLRYRSLFV